MGLMTHTPSVGSVKRSRSQIESFRPAISSMSMLPVLPLLVAATCNACQHLTISVSSLYPWSHR